MPLVQTEAGAELHEVRHGCAEVLGVWRSDVLSHVHIRDDDAACGIHVGPVETGSVIGVLPDDAKIPYGRRVALSSGGDGRFRNAFATLHQNRALFAETDEDGRFSSAWACRLAAGENGCSGEEQKGFVEWIHGWRWQVSAVPPSRADALRAGLQ